MLRAFKYYEDNFAMLESAYPYTSGATGDDSTDCLYSASRATNVQVKGTGGLNYNKASQLKAFIYKQPVSIAVAANNKYIHSYASGVIDATDCDYSNLSLVNHGVLAVGYGTDKATGLDYVLVKNSWNTTWGDKGYFKLSTRAEG